MDTRDEYMIATCHLLIGMIILESDRETMLDVLDKLQKFAHETHDTDEREGRKKTP